MKTAFKVLNFLMGTLILYVIVGLSYDFFIPYSSKLKFSENSLSQGSIKSDKSSEKNSLGSFNEYDLIYKKNLFGTIATKIRKKPDIDISNLKETKLNLKLLGTVVGYSSSYAVILSDNKQGLYREEDRIKDALIKRIFRQKVVLTRNGRDEILVIEEQKGQKAEYYKSIDESINQSGENEYRISREFINKSLQNINGLMRQARVRPNFANGNPDGIKIDNIRPFSLFRKMGLNNGDIITGANGKKIKTVNDAMGLYNGLKSSDKVSIQIRRAGQSEELEYNISE